MAKGKTYLAHAVGRRKSSIARVYVAEGTGKITINKRDFNSNPSLNPIQPHY